MSWKSDKAIRQHSEAVREGRTQRANDERIARGEMPKHCGRPVRVINDGDYQCVKCGDVFI